MKKKFILILFFLFSLIFSGSAKANYWLIIGTYRQGPGARPEVSGITSPSLHSIPMRDLDTCNKAGEKITNERGHWKEVILKNKTFPLMITFNPSYLIRFPENKKHSWEDLKKIRDKIKDLKLKI